MGQYRLTINSAGKKAGSLVELDPSDPLVKHGFAKPLKAAKTVASAPTPPPVSAPVVEEAPAEEAPVEEASAEDASAEESKDEEASESKSSRRRRSSSDE